jgi:hypothetical protein
MDAYDSLPPGLRLACRQSFVEPRATEFLSAWYRLEWTAPNPWALIPLWVAEMRRRDLQLVATFAQQYEQRWGRPYPHTAARATILYSEPFAY